MHSDFISACIFVVLAWADLSLVGRGYMSALRIRLLLLSGLIVIASFVTACNVTGFFTSYGDDPVWVDPDADAKKDTGGGDEGGPGKVVYGKICASCHLGNGKGVPGNNIPPLAGSALAVDGLKPVKIVLHGFRGEIERNGVKINGQMAAWKDKLSDQEIADVLTYVRTSFGNSGAPVTADEVKAVREETASRLVQFTESEL